MDAGRVPHKLNRAHKDSCFIYAKERDREGQRDCNLVKGKPNNT